MARQQQDYQPPQQQQSQAQQYPTQPQINQAYGAQPAVRPIQFPPPAPGSQPIPSQPEQFPPQNPTQPAAYPPVQFPPQPAAYPPQGPQNLPNQPVQYPPPSPQMNPTYPSGPNQPAAYPPQGPQPTSGTYPPQGKPEVYPPRGQGYDTPPSPYKPAAAQGIPLGMNQTPQQQNYTEQWKTGLFDCMEDPNSALITACFPCITFGQIAEILDNGQTTCEKNGLVYGLIAFCIAMPCIMSCGYRTKLRDKYGLVEAPGPDWAVHCLFEWCALCQEYRELQHRGFDPAIGWQGNVVRQNMRQQQVAMTPPMNQQMMP